MEIKEQFENIYRVKSINKKISKIDKKILYDFFLDGYECAIIDIDEK